LLGAAFGAGLRSEPDLSAEDLLPISPRRRSGEALLAAGLSLLALALLILIVSAAVSSSWRTTLLGQPDPNALTRIGFWNQVMDWFRNREPVAPPFVTPAFKSLALVSVYSLLAGFACAYAIGNAVLGGSLGILATVGVALPLLLGLQLQQAYPARPLFHALPIAAGLIALAGAAAPLWLLPPILERGVRRIGLAATLALAGLAAGTAASAGSFFLFRHRLINALSFASCSGKDQPGGTLLRRMDGALVWVGTSGDRTLLFPGETPDYWHLLAHASPEGGLNELEWDRDGNLWGRRRTAGPEPACEVWRGGPGRPMSLQFSVPTLQPCRLTHTRQQLWLDVVTRKADLLLPLPPGSKPRWQKIPAENLSSWLEEAQIREGTAGRLSPDHRRLTFEPSPGLQKSCLLPGPAAQEFLPELMMQSAFGRVPEENAILGADAVLPSGPVFLVPVSLASKKGVLVVCRPDGSTTVERTLEGDYSSPRRTLNGWPWMTDEHGRRLLLADDQARFLPPLDLDPVREWVGIWPEVVRADERNVWIVADNSNWLIRLDRHDPNMPGRWKIPQPGAREEVFLGLQVIPDGVFALDGQRLYFLDWEGRLKDLGPA
jgi:hypothetical protein